MKTVHKFQIFPTNEKQSIDINDGARILSVGFQGNNLFLWAFVDTENELKPRYFHIFGTGHDIPDGDIPCCPKFSYIGHARIEGVGFEGFVFESSVA